MKAKIKFKPGDIVICNRNYEREDAYKAGFKTNPKSVPCGGKRYIVCGVTVDYLDRVWIGLSEVSDGMMGWSQDNFVKYEPAKKKDAKRLIRL